MEINILYTKFERFWHWTQMALVVILLITGFEIHGNIQLFGFDFAVRLHNTSAWAFIGLTALTIFWMFAVGHWRNYMPTRKNFREQIRYYTSGILKNEPSPHADKTFDNKFNPLQRIVYLGLIILAFPAQIITGLLYMYFRYPGNPIDGTMLRNVAITHTVIAFLVIVFLIIHLYMTTTGKKVTTHVKEMITGVSDHAITEKQELTQQISDK
ncbi:MAG: cytochrome b/b6 domain-containing protein [Bacteroidales bacterium]|nr:cytochrome b/b6 domain-containing protein [Bacteroidales bacterium]MDZ4204986.1 cytochrome b/b6 domain-containing protein [Bacteroidales bacterium]